MTNNSSNGNSLTRRHLLKTGAGVALSVGLSSPFVRASHAANGNLVYATWGGSWETAIRKAWFEPFTKATGISVTTAQDNTYGKFQSMVENKSVEWDVCETDPAFQFFGAKKGLLEPLDFSIIDKSKIMEGKDFTTEFAIPQVLWSRLLVYNTNVLKTAPADFSAVFNDLSNFPGMRALYNNPNSGAFEAALLADGVPPDQLYPLDIERALKKWESIRAEIMFYETNAQAQQYITEGRASLSIMADGRAQAAIEEGAPVAIQYNQSILTRSCMLVPKGAPNRENAMKFLAYIMTPEAQAAIAKEYAYGPVVPEAFKLIPEARANILSGGPQMQGKFVVADESWWADNIEGVTERLTEWRLG